MQSKEQILQVANAWKRPDGLRDTEANGETIAKAIDEFFGGMWSHGNLDSAVAKLGDRLAYNVKIIERTAPAQAQEQVNAIYREWRQKYAPNDLLDTAENIQVLNAYVKTFFAGVYSITSLNEAAANAEGLQRRTAAEVREEAEAKERERMSRDFRESIKPQRERNFAEEAAAHEKAKKDKAKQEAARVRANSLISGYIANRSNGPGQDHGLTQTRQAELRRIANSKSDAVEALAAVEARIMEYPG